MSINQGICANTQRGVMKALGSELKIYSIGARVARSTHTYRKTAQATILAIESIIILLIALGTMDELLSEHG